MTKVNNPYSSTCATCRLRLAHANKVRPKRQKKTYVLPDATAQPRARNGAQRNTVRTTVRRARPTCIITLRARRLYGVRTRVHPAHPRQLVPRRSAACLFSLSRLDSCELCPDCSVAGTIWLTSRESRQDLVQPHYCTLACRHCHWSDFKTTGCAACATELGATSPTPCEPCALLSLSLGACTRSQTVPS